MDLGAAGLNEQPFRTHGKPLSVVSYASQQLAIGILESTLQTPHGLSLFQGPTLSGKSTIIRQFVDALGADNAVAVIDGSGLNTTTLLETVLRQFGYEFDHSSTSELMGMLRVFAMQQASSSEPPLLIIENTDGLNRSALRALCELADLTTTRQSALKMVLVSDRSLLTIVAEPEMDCIYRRLTHDFHLRPMTNVEAMDYLHEKLHSAGSKIPEHVFPASVCTELWRASGGWPGILDRIALLSLAKAESLPVSIDEIERPALPRGTWDTVDRVDAEQKVGVSPGPPTLYVSRDGTLLQELTFDKSRLLIGRSDHNDIPIVSKFVSRHHALLVRHGGSTCLMDLNSTNGTFVNSRRVSNHVLIHDDIVSIGTHRIKFHDPHANKRGALDGAEFADTAIMKSLEDIRNLLARENTKVVPALKEYPPTKVG